MRCKACHYSLTNLTEHRCPECGRAFDPHFPHTFDQRCAKRIHESRIVWFIVGLVALLLGVGLYIDYNYHVSTKALALIALGATLTIMLVCVVLKCAFRR